MCASYFMEVRDFAMLRFRFILIFATLVCATLNSATASFAQTVNRAPADVVREFYRSMREHRFREAFALTIYKSAVEGLTAEELEVLRPGFEEKASQIPATVEVVSEQISGNIAIVFIKIPPPDTSPQVTTAPVNLISSGGSWLIGSEADQAEVKKGGRRYFLDGLIAEHENDIEDTLKRVIVLEGIYSQRHNGVYGDVAALISGGLMSADVVDPKLSGYNFRIAVAKDGKSYIATAEPTRHGHTGKLSFWMDQTGLIKSADTGGKPIKP
jgi:hypothetical protein